MEVNMSDIINNITLSNSSGYLKKVYQCIGTMTGNRYNGWVRISILSSLFLFSLGLQILGEGTGETASLLTGATASSYTVPSGWQVLDVQGFESGSIDTTKEFISGSLTTARTHTGTYSVRGTISRDASSARWGLLNIASSEQYWSWWEYLDSQGRMNDEMFEWYIRHVSPIFQETIFDWFQNSTGTFNSINGGPLLEPQGAYYGNIYFPQTDIDWGLWTQWEVHYKANTPGLSDGVFQVWKNGAIWIDKTNKNLNGSVDMSNSQAQIGGSYGKMIWRHSDGTCGAFIGDGDTIGHPPVAGGERCTDFNNCACPPNPPIFSRFFDDVIVLVPNGQPMDTQPPSPPTGLIVR